MKKKNFDLPTELSQLISSELAYEYRIIPINTEKNSITFLTDSNKIENLKSELQIVLGKSIILEEELTSNIDSYLQKNYRKRNRKSTASLQYSEDFLLNIIHEAKEIGSSDIHFESFEKQKRVRFRIAQNN
jgi:type IV pilus assembly protein PilB